MQLIEKRTRKIYLITHERLYVNVFNARTTNKINNPFPALGRQILWGEQMYNDETTRYTCIYGHLASTRVCSLCSCVFLIKRGFGLHDREVATGFPLKTVDPGLYIRKRWRSVLFSVESDIFREVYFKYAVQLDLFHILDVHWPSAVLLSPPIVVVGLFVCSTPCPSFVVVMLQNVNKLQIAQCPSVWTKKRKHFSLYVNRFLITTPFYRSFVLPFVRLSHHCSPTNFVFSSPPMRSGKTFHYTRFCFPA